MIGSTEDLSARVTVRIDAPVRLARPEFLVSRDTTPLAPVAVNVL